jgi:hypothetical protein
MEMETMNQEENEQSKPVPHPVEMERQFHRQDYKNGEFTIVFRDAAHLVDSWNYADKIGKGAEFERALMRLLRTNVGRCLPRKCSEYEGNVIPATEGKESKLVISPDSHTAPSFFWCEEPRGMVGGLIFHSYSGEWGIHT